MLIFVVILDCETASKVGGIRGGKLHACVSADGCRVRVDRSGDIGVGWVRAAAIPRAAACILWDPVNL